VPCQELTNMFSKPLKWSRPALRISRYGWVKHTESRWRKPMGLIKIRWRCWCSERILCRFQYDHG